MPKRLAKQNTSGLTPDQRVALDGIIKFIHSPIADVEDTCTVMYAAAGRGKTFLTRKIANAVRGSHRIAGVAPTHKARKVLDNVLNSGSLLKVKTMTIASLLNTMRAHSYIGTKNYVRGEDSKMHLFDLFLIDEASMITDADVNCIKNYALKFKKKVLFIGDKFQIPNPSQKYQMRNGVGIRKDSIAFDCRNSFELTTNMRQSEDNPIVDLYDEMRLAIAENREPQINRETRSTEAGGAFFYTEQEDWEQAIKDCYNNLDGKPLHSVRIIAYTNDTVKNHNLLVRRLYERGPIPEVGELLMGYNNIGWPEKIVENSQDYYVVDVQYTDKHVLAPETKNIYRGIQGHFLTIKETDSDLVSEIFMPDISAESNQKMLKDLVSRAEKVNKKKSTKDDFKRYCRLKNQLTFMENVYKMGDDIMGEGEFRNANPLMFRGVNEMIVDCGDGDREILDNKLTKDISEKYGEILIDRMDDDKSLAGGEKLCDQFCVIERDIDYGMCITAHKSQGSNYTKVFVDEADFDKLKNSWNYAIGSRVETTRERTQLKYVAFTRPTSEVHVFYRKETEHI